MALLWKIRLAGGDEAPPFLSQEVVRGMHTVGGAWGGGAPPSAAQHLCGRAPNRVKGFRHRQSSCFWHGISQKLGAGGRLRSPTIHGLTYYGPVNTGRVLCSENRREPRVLFCPCPSATSWGVPALTRKTGPMRGSQLSSRTTPTVTRLYSG